MRTSSNHQPDEPHNKAYTEDYNELSTEQNTSRNRKRTMWLRSGCRNEKCYFHDKNVIGACNRNAEGLICVLLTTQKHLIKSNMKNC